MVNPISANSGAVNKNSAASQPPAKPEVAPVKTDVPKADVVELSNSAQAKLLKQQGLTIAQIAIKMSLDVKTVATYLPSVSTKG